MGLVQGAIPLQLRKREPWSPGRTKSEIVSRRKIVLSEFLTQIIDMSKIGTVSRDSKILDRGRNIRNFPTAHGFHRKPT